MGWLQQSYKQSLHGRSSGGISSGRDVMIHRGQRKARRRQPILSLAAIAMAALLGPLDAVAFEPSSLAQVPRGRGGLQMMSEEELRRVFGRALPQDLLFRTSRSVTSGVDVRILGDMATLMNPVSSLLDAEVTFRDAIFNPLNPTTLIDRTGSYMIRVPDSIGMFSFENIRIRGSNTTNFGSVTIRNIDMRGTAIRVTIRN